MTECVPSSTAGLIVRSKRAYVVVYLAVVLMYLSKAFFERSLHWWSHKAPLTTRNLIIVRGHTIEPTYQVEWVEN
jgi:glucose dehydrogenase